MTNLLPPLPIWHFIAFPLAIAIELSIHYYLIEYKQIWFRKKEHRIALVARSIYMITIGVLSIGVSVRLLQLMFIMSSFHWMVWDYGLNYVRGKPWHHVNDDVIFDDILDEKDPLVRLALKSFVLILAIMVYHFL